MPLHVRQGVLDGIKSQRIIAGAHVDPTGGVCPMVAAEPHVRWRTVSRANVRSAQDAARAWDRYAQATGASRTATKRQLLALTSMLEASILAEHAEVHAPPTDVMAEFERSRTRLERWSPAPRREETEAREAREARVERVVHEPFAPEPHAPERVAETTIAAPHAPEPYAPEPYAPHAPEPYAPEPVSEPPLAAPAAPAPARTTRPSLRKRRDTGERDRTRELAEREGWAWLRPFRSYDEYEQTLLRALAEIDDAHARQREELHVG